MSTDKEPTSADAEGATSGSEPAKERKKSRIDWDDPNVPVGNAPPLPRWPLFVASLAWVGWVVFLAVMLAR